MKRFGTFILVNLSLVLVLSACSAKEISIQEVIDGDTLTFNDARTVRLLQIDTPELKEGECYAKEAKAELESLLTIVPIQSNGITKELRTFNRIQLERDPVSLRKDTYGRELGYVIIGRININLELVRRGAASPYFYDGQKGKYSRELISAVNKAKAERLGVWGICPAAVLDLTEAFSSGDVEADVVENGVGETLVLSGGANCDSNYAGCIPIYPPDLDCPDIRALGLAPIHRIAGDPHKLDRDNDGVGCE